MKKCTKQLPDIYLTEGICRSRSFGGLSHRRTNSADATFSSGIDFSFDGNTTKTLYSTVGTTYCPSSSLRLKDSILLAKNDISSSRLAFDNVSVSSVMQMKAGERYLKKLEFHLSKLEELKEQYDVQHKIRDGIRSMGYAYILSPGN
ncbi:rho family-interacting cell polarization regulator 2 [Caerostris extrusa]|uniref:Rho family-interacting cell polarization regulator 2 n=1 Tax=Caerostris extrusa TaxID=172846 RepID=A0AAV4U6K0_CAEEX|nr:rho family-interacting cell polarization regulator 2 [Caerostris extrusa]